MGKIAEAKEAIKLAKDAKKLKALVREAKKHPAKAFEAALETAKEHPVDAALMATGPEDPLAWEGAGDLAEKYEKKLESELDDAKDAANRAEKAASAAAAGAKAASTNHGKTKMTDGSLMAGLLNEVNALEGSSSGRTASSMAKLLWVWAIIVQGADAFWFQFNRTSTLQLAIVLYTSISVWAFFVFKDEGIISGRDIRKLFFFFTLSAFYVLVPVFLWVIPDMPLFGGPSLLNWVSFFLAIIPFWPIYISSKIDDATINKFTKVYINFWILFLILLAIYTLAFKVNTGAVVAAGGRPELVEAKSVFDFLMQKTAETGKKVWNAMSFTTIVKNVANASGLNYYTGQIDGNEKEPVGFYINNVRPADKYFYVGDPVIVWADIRGKSFNEEIVVTPHCYIDAVGKNGEAGGIADPKKFRILGEEHDSFQCTFENLSKGSYSARIQAPFTFETWAYVTYTYVDIELKRAMEVQGKSINSELDIPRYPEAVYTNGPVMLGMGSMVDQPIGVDVDVNNRDAILGVTLDDVWTEGKSTRVDEFIIQVPDDFELVNCDRWREESERTPFESKDGYDFYRFVREELTDPRAQFKSVTCRVHIKDPKQFLAGQQKVQRTFITQAKYEYEIVKTTSVTVKE